MKSRRLFIASGIFLIATLACVFMALRPPENGVRIPVHASNGKIGYIDSTGRMVIDAKWDAATPFGPDNRAHVTVKQKTSSIGEFFGRWIPVLRRFGTRGMRIYRIDRLGNTALHVLSGFDPLDQAAVPPHSDEMTLVEQGTGFRWALKDGSLAFPGNWQRALDFKIEDTAAVFKDGRWGFIDRRGKEVIPFQWDETHGFDGNGRACVAVDRKWGIIDREGRLVVPLNFKSLAGFDVKNMCSARLASGCGFIDPNGKILIPFRYRKTGTFDRFDMAKIEITDPQGAIRCGWINRRGEAVVQPLYQVESPLWASNFKDHELLPVIGPNGPGMIDRKGRTVIATAQGELLPIEDPAAPGKFWITTVPHPWVTPPPGSSLLPFQPACYDQTGKLIWSDGIATSSITFTICAVLSGLISVMLFAIGGRPNRSHSLTPPRKA